MFSTLVKKIFGSRNERTLNRMEKLVIQINAMEPLIQALSDSELAGQTQKFKQRLEQGESLDNLLPEAFAVVREAAIRTLGMRHFDVQLIGGMVLHDGKIAEMRTGEGKTLAATLPAYLNALTGKGVHIVTVNDYLAKRDAHETGPLYNFLGLSVGVIYPDMPHEEKQAAYQTDILFGTNNEFGFDYLRDNMAFSPKDKVQYALNFAIIDEVDSILIDEARTPLIISGAAEGTQELYIHVNKIIPELREQKEEGDGGDYTIEAKQKQAHLTEEGHQNVEAILVREGLLEKGQSLYHAANIILMHHVNAALRAHVMFHRDVEYIVKDNQVVIVDEHTGRGMPGRRWSDGLHQAVEAKENVPIQRENQTLASITFQNYFRLYNKLSGMTGTADTEAFEFQQIYNLEVVVIPTNKPMIRGDEADLVYLSLADKFEAIIEDVKDAMKRNQPVLVGTASIESSEMLSHLMTKAGIKHQVLNAKFHEQEAHIIAEAGRPGVVTIATNMAGRGTDIVLGGNLKAQLAALPDSVSEEERNAISNEWNQRHQTVIQAGGLRIIGSERHESRRIDNQLRGRSGRQGDPGSSRFYLSLDDNLMRIFTSERVISMMRKLGMKPGEPIEHKLVTRAIENAQRKLEGYHFDVRKQLLDYDNVANNQRQVIYTQRADIMAMSDPGVVIDSMRLELIEQLVDTYIPPQSMEDLWDLPGFTKVLQDEFQLTVDVHAWVETDHQLQPEQMKEKLLGLFLEQYANKTKDIDPEVRSQFEKSLILQVLDSQWREHLAAMDYLRQGIHLRGYAQKDPRQEYKREAFDLFTSMLQSIKYDIIRTLSSVTIEQESEADLLEMNRMDNQIHNLTYSHDEEPNIIAPQNMTATPVRRHEQKTGRNESCPCGSGKKYKHCHGSFA